MKLRYVVVDDVDKEVVKSFKGFISALRFAKTLEKPYIYEYKVEDDKSFSEDDWECVWNWEDQWDEDTAVNLILNRQYKEVAKDADQIDDNHASDAFTSMIEDFELNIRKTPDKVEVSTSGDEAGEVFDFARAILGDNFEAFDQDFPDPEEDKVSELAPAEFEYDFDEDDIQDDTTVDPDDAFSEVEFKGPRTEDEITDSEDSAEDAVTEPSEKSTEDSVEDDVVEPQDVVPAAEKALLDTIAETPADESPKDMIDGKLVDAKDPTEGEVEVEEEPKKDLKETLGWADMEFSPSKYDFETEHCEVSVQDYEFSYRSKDCWVSFYLLRPEDEKVIYITLTGLDASDVEIETGSDSWSDPGVYPNAVAGGPLSSYSYSTVEDAKLLGKPSDLNYSFSDEQDQPITEEQAKEFLGVSEEEYQTIITKVKEAGFEAFSDIAHDWALDPDHWDTFFEDYTGTPEIRTTHLEYTDKDVTDGKAVLPDNITKSEDNHCKKINKGINHDMDPKEKELLKESLNKVWNCIWDGEVLGQVEAETEDEAYTKMENTWPELPFGFVDGIAYVELADNLDEFLDAKIDLGADLHNFGGQNNDVDVLNTQNESVCKDGEKCVNEGSDTCKKKSTKDKLAELLDLDLGVNVDAHEFGGTGNKVDVLNSGLPKLEALEDEPGYDELLQYIHNRRAKKGIKAESLNTKDDMSDEEFVEAFGQELVKNNIKPKKVCKGKSCKVKEDWSELYDEDGMDNYDFSDIDVAKNETASEDNDEWDWDWDALAQDEEEKEWGKEALESDNLDHDINV